MTDSIWWRTLSEARRAVLERTDELPSTTDVLVIGGGLVGLAVADQLAARGAGSVTVIDRDGPAAEASSANAGGLWFGHESVREGLFGRLTPHAEKAHAALTDELDFDVRRGGVLDLFWRESEAEALREKARALTAAGFRAEVVERAQLRTLEPILSDVAAGALLTPDDGQLHPVDLAGALVERLRERGGRFCRGVEALGLGDPVETTGGPVAAGAVVVACGAWTPLVTEAVGWKPPIKPIRGVLMALAEQPAGTVRHTVMGRDYYCWQLSAGFVGVGGSHEDVGFSRGVDDETTASIRAELAELAPALAEQGTVCAWSGFRPHCEDGYPVIGRAPRRDGLFVAAGHYRKGVMLAPLTGKLLAEQIIDGVPSVEIAELDPARFSPAPA